jgi:hypothetical protein
MEMMTRARGFEETARKLRHTYTFGTLTTPSAFHPQLSSAGANPRFAGHTAGEAQQWLNKMFARARAELKRHGILFYGFRIAEPHHDGTPHWHVLLFAPVDQLEELKSILRKHWLSEFGDEPGAEQYRIVFKDEDKQRPDSSAAGYIAKYIGKNIDGYAIDQDYESGLDAVESSERVEAWASIHGIRQFQQIGGPPVGAWREVRRLRQPTPLTEIEPARAAASDRSNWSEFIDAHGGIAIGRNGNIQLWKSQSGERNRYGENRGQQTIGVRSLTQRIRTRLHKWKIEYREAVRALLVSSWTRVNNCTQSEAGQVRLQIASEPARAGPTSAVSRLASGEPGELLH